MAGLRWRVLGLIEAGAWADRVVGALVVLACAGLLALFSLTGRAAPGGR